MRSAKRLHAISAWMVSAALLAPPVLPATGPAEQDVQGPVIRSEVNLVVVEATVKDRAGQVIKDLRQEDFLLYEEGALQKIAHFSRDELPLAVALVVDLSGSLQPFLRPLRYATLTALHTLKAEDQVALFTFSHEVELLEDLSPNKRAVSDHFEDLRAEGSTNINDALFLAAEYLRQQAPRSRRVIVLVSDNVPTDPGTVSPEQVVREILEADTGLYSIKVPGRNNPAVQWAGGAVRRAFGHDMVNVSRVAAETGGEVFDVEKEGSLFLAFQTVIDRLKTRYTLGYYPSNRAIDGRFRRLDVQLAPRWGARGSQYTILTKRGYYAPRDRGAVR